MRSEAAPLTPKTAEETLREVERLRHQTRTGLGAFWFPLVLFGALSLASAAVAPLAGGEALGVYWAIAGPLGGIAISAYYYRRERTIGVQRPAAPYVVTAVGIIVGTFVVSGIASTLGYAAAAAAAPAIVVSVGYVAFAWLERSGGLAAIAAVLAALAAILWASRLDADALAIVLALAYGAVWLATGVAYRLRAPRG